MARRTSFLGRALVLASLAMGVFCINACAVTDDLDGEEEESGLDDEGDDSYEATSEALKGPGPCAGKAIDRAVRCAQSKGAKVLSFYRSPEEQEETQCRERRTPSC